MLTARRRVTAVERLGATADGHRTTPAMAARARRTPAAAAASIGALLLAARGGTE